MSLYMTLLCRILKLCPLHCEPTNCSAGTISKDTRRICLGINFRLADLYARDVQLDKLDVIDFRRNLIKGSQESAFMLSGKPVEAQEGEVERPPHREVNCGKDTAVTASAELEQWLTRISPASCEIIPSVLGANTSPATRAQFTFTTRFL